MFARERLRQRSLIPRLEKIEVEYVGAPENATLILNKDISTPHDVAKHLSDRLTDRSALALVDTEHLWDMHRPLEASCRVELLHFHAGDPRSVNSAFWRTCSFLLGSVLTSVFRDANCATLHSFPAPNVSSGSFVHDASLSFSDGEWTPTKEELVVMGAAMHKLAEKAIPIERLEVGRAFAEEMFSDNEFKLKQIPDIASKSASGNTVTLYKAGDHVDISRGPMVGNTSFLGRRCSIMAAHKIKQPSDGADVYRFQGVALPKNMLLNHFAFSLLEKRAAKLNIAERHLGPDVPPPKEASTVKE